MQKTLIIITEHAHDTHNEQTTVRVAMKIVIMIKMMR